MSVIWTEGSNDQNDLVSDIIGYIILLLVFFVAAVVVGAHK